MNNTFKTFFKCPTIPQYAELSINLFNMKADKVMLWLLIVQWFIATFITSIAYDTYIYGFFSGALIVLPMLFLYKYLKGDRYYRIFIAIALMLFSIVYIQQYLGRIEMHFYVFIAMAILTLYKDIVPLIVAAIVTILHHVIFNYLQLYEVSLFDMPVMIFNYGCGFDIVILHAIFVISELFILGYIIRLQVEHSIDLNTTQSRVNELNSELQYTSSHDMLTGLPNRIYLHEQLQNIKNLSETNNKRFALIFLDLDHFKNINDTLGHDVGDALLKTVANILTANLPKESLITRIGGDEFILVISNFEDPSEILPIINILLQEFRNELLIKGYSLRLSASMGISIYPDDSTNIKELMKYSDIAMYKAKSDGRDNFSFFTQSLNNKIHQEVDLINDMQRAYYDNEFELYYQPKVDVKTQKIIGAEALIRWNHKTRGMIGPNIFIALAESTGFILSLGKFVIAQSTKDIKEFSSLGLKNLKISINVSTRQFQNGDLYTDLKSAMQQSKIDPKQLGIEITESIMMQHVSKTIATLQSIKDLGISIYIDDFGTGYSSLAYLKSFPIDTLKIDKTFVDDICENESNDGIILNTILAMGKSLGLKVIAEGVEEKYQFEYLKEKECDIIQGYYFAKPMKKEDFIALLQK